MTKQSTGIEPLSKLQSELRKSAINNYDKGLAYALEIGLNNETAKTHASNTAMTFIAGFLEKCLDDETVDFCNKLIKSYGGENYGK